MPLAVLGCFIAMKIFGVDANIVSLSGIAIAVGTIVDMGIVICENILKHLDEDPAGYAEGRGDSPCRGGGRKCGIVGLCLDDHQFYSGIFYERAGRQTLQAAGVYKDICIVCLDRDRIDYHPAGRSYYCFSHEKIGIKYARTILYGILALAGLVVGFVFSWLAGLAIIGFAVFYLFRDKIPQRIQKAAPMDRQYYRPDTCGDYC